MTRLVVHKGATYAPSATDATVVVGFDEVREWLRGAALLRHVLRYRSVELHTERIATLAKPFATASILRVMSRGSCKMIGADGGKEHIGLATLARLARQLVADQRRLAILLSEVRSVLDRLEDGLDGHLRHLHRAGPVYVRSDLVFGLEAGGSVGHIAGVLNNLAAFSGAPLFVTTDNIPTVDKGVDTVMVVPNGRYRDFTDVPLIAFNTKLLDSAVAAIADRDVGFVYQRYSAYNYTGLALAQRQRVPFVLEYNGSEVWINRNWGRPLKYEDLAERIEILNLRASDLVVVVSDVMRDELLGRGIEGDKILVNPNGVDPEMYSPDVDGTAVREQLGIVDEYVIGFIGTFGRWHGAEKLAVAFNQLLDRRPELRERTRLLMIGDGVGLPATRKIIEAGGYADRVIFTGRVPQVDGPAHLAACDLLVSPHVPNPDGTRFFGSPTKLFEYMAMGKPIVASRLDQIADVLEDGRTAAMVEPGNVESLVGGMERVIDDPELALSIGRAVRDEAVRNHTWREHTRRIVEALRERCA